MTDDRPTAGTGEGKCSSHASPAGEAVKVIFGLADSVTELKTKNDALYTKVAELRRDVDQQAGQVKVLM